MANITSISQPYQGNKRPIRNLFWQRAVRRLLRDYLTLFALFGVLSLVLLCVFGPPIIEPALNINPNRTA
ncbi:MAG: hypothetical protein J0M07_32900, partial [Anaerolineae bacterium]|nr:hypothetical protein [Anaerolineae bacterium]